MGACVLSGCSPSVPLPGATGGSIWKSFDGGQTFVPKVTVDEKRRIASADVLAFVIDPDSPETIYIGTMSNGLFKTTDGAEHWEPLEFPPLKNYGLALDRNDRDRIYASGVYNDIAKIYRSDDAGKNWKEIYTEPGAGTVITALGSSPDIPGTLYAGTSAGVIIKSTNGGDTWDNIGSASGAVTRVLFEKGMSEKVLLLVFNGGMRVSADGGKTWADHTGTTLSSFGTDQVRPDGITTVVTDPKTPGTLYAGAKNGLFRSRDSGQSWQALDIIESSKKFPVRAVAVNPANSGEIVYASGSAFYKTTDGGVKWATTELAIDRSVNILEYDPSRPEALYFTLRKF